MIGNYRTMEAYNNCWMGCEWVYAKWNMKKGSGEWTLHVTSKEPTPFNSR